jgi:hypothetical protein
LRTPSTDSISFIVYLNEEETARVYLQQYGATAHATYTFVALLREVVGEQLISKKVWSLG